MSEKTKACNLTENEIKELLRYHGNSLHDPREETIDRINYLNKRLKTFNEVDNKPVTTSATPSEKVGW